MDKLDQIWFNLLGFEIIIFAFVFDTWLRVQGVESRYMTKPTADIIITIGVIIIITPLVSTVIRESVNRK